MSNEGKKVQRGGGPLITQEEKMQRLQPQTHQSKCEATTNNAVYAVEVVGEEKSACRNTEAMIKKGCSSHSGCSTRTIKC